jgi:CRISPR-associated endonuclease/helicase Cas3
MLPWIRGWGADVEVLAPTRLRAALEDEVRRLGQVYAQSTAAAVPVKAPPFGVLWAKSDPFTGGVHRLIYHLIDVGKAAHGLWEQALPKPVRAEIAAGLSLSPDEAGTLCAFVAALHDLGKACPTFQHHRSLSERMRRRFEIERRAAGFSQVISVHDPTPHQYVTTQALKLEGLLEPFGFDPSVVRQIAQALGGHHGAWPAAQLLMTFKATDRGDDTWQQARRDIVAALLDVFAPPRQARLPDDLTQRNRILTLISALVSVADWLGSDAESFPLREDWMAPRAYAALSQKLADSAVARSDWRQPPEWRRATEFTALFGFDPRPTQSAALELAGRLDQPFLAIVEAPMGLGKTEIALALYAQWAARTDQTGLFVAMPTTATSNQMYGRVSEWVGRWFGQDHVPLLVHSRSLLQLPTSTGEDPETNEGADLRRSWLLPKKRSLLASFGVGTVDQTFLSVLQTKHFFVRLLGLSHKVVIFDEVHAYDTYMSTLFEHLLRWLRELGVAVIVLSATLPSVTRQRLIAAYGGRPERVRQAGYPTLSYTTGQDTETAALTTGEQPRRRLRVDWVDRAPDAILVLLREALKDGGCAAVVCNTVRSAQALYEALADSEFAQLGEHLILFHARTLQVWRQQAENQVLSLFGPPHKSPARPHTAIVVATQVIEQSLDLDFDVMISELAPIDLVLQRAGRLHRHERPDRRHPYQLWIAGQRPGPGVPDLPRGDIQVYEKAVLLASWAALGEHGAEIQLPDDLPVLVERVYDPDAPLPADEALRAALVTARDAMRVSQEQDAHAAKSRLVPGPDSEDLLLDTNLGLEEDDPAVNKTFQALTRADEPGLTVVCVFEGLNGFELDPEEPGQPIDVFDPSPRGALALANNALSIQRKDIVGLVLAQEVSLPERWRRSALLRYSRLAVFRDNVCELSGERGTVRLELTRRFGLRTLTGAD